MNRVTGEIYPMYNPNNINYEFTGNSEVVNNFDDETGILTIYDAGNYCSAFTDLEHLRAIRVCDEQDGAS